MLLLIVIEFAETGLIVIGSLSLRAVTSFGSFSLKAVTVVVYIAQMHYNDLQPSFICDRYHFGTDFYKLFRA